MKWNVLACDYDGTLAHDGVLEDATANALDRFRRAGGRLLMVTGRELPDLQSVCRVLELQVIFNKGAVMVLPFGVDKATGLTVALKEMKVLPAEVVAIGDAEND